MKLGVFSNFVYPHIGGSELVIEAISKRLSKMREYDVNIYGHNIKSFVDNGRIKRYKASRDKDLIKQINCNDVVWIYSDSFWGLNIIFDNIKDVNPNLYITVLASDLLGSKSRYVDIVNKYSDKIFLKVHEMNSYNILKNIGIEKNPVIIPNGFDLSEFENNSKNFKRKYNLENKKIILNVANYFHGKGQDLLPDIVEPMINRGNKDFAVVSISSCSNYPYERYLLNKVRNKANKSNVPIIFLRNINREFVISAFKQSDIFAFTSLKEVAPLVIMECMAASLPWISFPVGNVRDLRGGRVVDCDTVDGKGFLSPSKKDLLNFSYYLNSFLEDSCRIEECKKELTKEDLCGMDWDNICDKYDILFRGGI